MRRTIPAGLLVISVSVLSTPVANAQDVQGGVKIGLNSSTLNFKESGDFDKVESRTGIVAGAFLVWPVTPSIAIQAEGLYSQKGASVSGQGVTADLQLDYVDVPVLARFSTSPGSRTAVHAFAGPSMNFKVRTYAESGFENATERVEHDITDSIKSFEAGLVVGAGVQVSRLLFEGRYSWGLTNVDAENLGAGGAVRNRGLSFTAGIRF